MAKEDELLKAVLDNPDTDAPRLAYADWCEQQNDPPTKARAEFIRIQITMVNQINAMSYEQWFDSSHREEELRRTYRDTWAGALVTLVDKYTFSRGFIELITLSGGGFLDRAPQLFALAPILHLKLTEVRSVADELFASPHLRNIRSLDLDRCGLDNAHLKMLAESPVLEHLRWLSVAENNLSLEGADALAASPLSKRLVYVNFYGNPDDPGGKYAVDNEFIMDSWLPEEGQILESRHGFLPWLHRDAQTVYELVPDRFRLSP